MVWDVGRRERRKTLAQEFSAICVVCSPDGGTTVCSTDFDQIVFNDLRTGTRRRLRTGGTQIYSLVYAKDGSRLFSGHADGSIRIWDVATEQQVDTILGHRGFVFGLAMSPDGRTLASGGADGTVRVWDVGSAQETLCLVDCKARVNAVAFSPDGRTLAAADHVGTITIWRSVTRRNGGLITEPEPAHADAAVATRAAVRSLGD
jgi:WD40 repeat protein